MAQQGGDRSEFSWVFSGMTRLWEPMAKTRSEDVLFTLAVQEGTRLVEGVPGRQILHCLDDARLVLEACGNYDVDRVLLYAENLTTGFFDLSSGEAGGILGKLRNYFVRLAVVCPPGGVRYSTRFAEMLAEERRGGYFNVFDSPASARAWLSAAPGSPMGKSFGMR